MHGAQHGLRRAILAGLLFWIVFGAMSGEVHARIRVPKIDELIDSADVIVVGKVESSRMVQSVIWNYVVTVVSLIFIFGVLAWLIRKRRFAIAFFFAIVAFDSYGLLSGVTLPALQRVAKIKILTTLKGDAIPQDIALFFRETGFICDETKLDASQEYLLFLKTMPGGYAPAWHDWSVWRVKDGFVQNDKRNKEPIALTEMTKLIEAQRNQPQQKP